MGERGLAAGDVVDGKYEIVGQLGRGGMAHVYDARRLELDTLVALKVLRPDLAGSSTFVGRFAREARAAARLESVHVARVLDVGALPDGAPYIVMERLRGRDLRAELRARGPIPAELAVDWVLEACEAVAEAHARGIVHRDLKPSNLFLARRDDGSQVVKVLDFGIAKDAHTVDASLTGTQDVFGSPHYMSPEQLRASGEVDARSDVWALGVVLFELTSGQTPFEGKSIAEVHAAVLGDTAPPIPGEVPDGLRLVVARCLQRDPRRRFASVAELARALAPFGSRDTERRVAAIEAWGGDATDVTGAERGTSAERGRLTEPFDGGGTAGTPHTGLSSPSANAPVAPAASSGAERRADPAAPTLPGSADDLASPTSTHTGLVAASRAKPRRRVVGAAALAAAIVVASMAWRSSEAPPAALARSALASAAAAASRARAAVEPSSAAAAASSTPSAIPSSAPSAASSGAAPKVRPAGPSPGKPQRSTYDDRE